MIYGKAARGGVDAGTMWLRCGVAELMGWSGIALRVGGQNFATFIPWWNLSSGEHDSRCGDGLGTGEGR